MARLGIALCATLPCLAQTGLVLPDADDPWLCDPPPAYWDETWTELADARRVAVRGPRIRRAERLLGDEDAIRLTREELDDLAEDWRMIDEGLQAQLVRSVALRGAQGRFAVYRHAEDGSLVVVFRCDRRCRSTIVHRPLIVLLEEPPPSVCARYEIGTLGD